MAVVRQNVEIIVRPRLGLDGKLQVGPGGTVVLTQNFRLVLVVNLDPGSQELHGSKAQTCAPVYCTRDYSSFIRAFPVSFAGIAPP
jgi:hypothetical protein